MKIKVVFFSLMICTVIISCRNPNADNHEIIPSAFEAIPGILLEAHSWDINAEITMINVQVNPNQIDELFSIRVAFEAEGKPGYLLHIKYSGEGEIEITEVDVGLLRREPFLYFHFPGELMDSQEVWERFLDLEPDIEIGANCINMVLMPFGRDNPELILWNIFINNCNGATLLEYTFDAETGEVVD